MEILKKKIEEYKYFNGLKAPFVALADLNDWLKEFEERQQDIKPWKEKCLKLLGQIEELEKNKEYAINYWEKLYKEQKKSAYNEEIAVGWKKAYNNEFEKVQGLKKANDDWKEKCHELEIKYAVLKTTFERASKYSWNPAVIFKTSEVQSPWIEIDTPPKDDATVWGINEAVSEIPFLVWYDEDCREFLLLDSTKAVPVAISHWMHLLPNPSEYDDAE